MDRVNQQDDFQEALRRAPDRHVVMTYVHRYYVKTAQGNIARQKVTRRTICSVNEKGEIDRLLFTESLDVVPLKVA